MIYICSKIDNVNNYWIDNIQLKDKKSLIDNNFFDFEKEFDNGDIVILDIDQFKTNEEIIEFFNNIPKSLKVVALVEDARLAQGAYLIKKGFKSYLSKKTNEITIKKILETIKDGNVWVYPDLMNYIIKHITLNNEEDNKENILKQLSPKEQVVANHIADGLSNKDISNIMDVQLVTVKKHISNIFTKLKIKDRVALAILMQNR
ncbi:MAG: response regulator transcription factor [Campylobacterota bacterium]|nr:response regulator transcription factor [Campylobacterota bacterium]